MQLEELRNHALIKSINRAKVLNAIRLHAPIGRAEIADRIGLDRKSLTNFISAMIAEGLVVEAEKRGHEGRRGRPHTMLRFQQAAVIGLEAAADQIRGVMLDFHGRVIRHAEHPCPHQAGGKLIAELLGRIHAELADPNWKIHGLGVCLPGIIDAATGQVKVSANLPGTVGMDLPCELRQTLGGTPLIEDSTRAKTLAEKWFGHGRSFGDFVCVDLDIGVGMGIVVARNLYRGAGDNAGELGHVIVVPNGRPCQCGHAGCLEAYLSSLILLAEINQATDANHPNLVTALAASGDAAPVRQIVARAGRLLGEALGTVVNLISPGVIVLSGQAVTGLAAAGFLTAVNQGLADHALPASLAKVRLLVSKLDDSAAKGAAVLALSQIFEVPPHYCV